MSSGVGVGHQCVHIIYNMCTQRIILAPSGVSDESLTNNFEKQMGLWVKDDVRKGVESYIEASFEMVPLHRRIDSLQSELERLKNEQKRPVETLWHNPFGYMPLPPFVRF